jgi:hypothetical protein
MPDLLSRFRAKGGSMNRKFVCAALATLVVFSVALADEFMAVITKVEDGKVTYKTFKFNVEEKKAEFGDAKTLPTSKDIKVVKGKFDKESKGKLTAGDPIENGLKNKMFTDIKTNDQNPFGGGLMAYIVTDKDNKNITEIRAFSFGGKKKKKDAGN